MTCFIPSRSWRALALALGLSSCAKAPPALPGPARSVESRAAGARENVAITVYNQNFGLVREERRVALGTGKVELAFADVAKEVQPETVHVRSLDNPEELSVLEQNYRFDLLSPETLLKKSLGKTINVYRYNEKLGTEEVKSAEVLAVENGVVLRIDGQVTSNFSGRFAFPEVPPALVSEPTLVWLFESQKPNHRLEVTYLTRGLNWSADYVLVLGADDKTGDLTGWVTLGNQSGQSYENARLKLVAGDVGRVSPDQDRIAGRARTAMPMAPPAPQFREESLFEYHLYSLGRPTTLRDREQKQVSLVEAQGFGLTKKLVFEGSAQYYRTLLRGPLPKAKVAAFLEFMNSEKNGLGFPLPKGVLRVYKASQSGAQEFVGEDRIDHTPKDEKLRVRLGESFDVVGERTQIRYSALGNCAAESEWSIVLRNHKPNAETVEILEPVGVGSGLDWELLESTHPAQRESVERLKFEVSVPAQAETTVRYRIRARWC